jgi:hypothetical protein
VAVIPHTAVGLKYAYDAHYRISTRDFLLLLTLILQVSETKATCSFCELPYAAVILSKLLPQRLIHYVYYFCSVSLRSLGNKQNLLPE